MTLALPVLLLAALLYGANWALSPRALGEEKALPYECGFSPLVGATGGAFPVAFYLVGLLFMLFDLEILLLYPFALLGEGLSAYELAGALLVFSLFSVGFIYEVRGGGLDGVGLGPSRPLGEC